MKTIIALSAVAIFMLLVSCTSRIKNRDHHGSTDEICDKIYVEHYVLSANGKVTGMTGEWLTDSVHFRLFAGTSDTSDLSLSYTCNADSVHIFESHPDSSGKRKTIEMKNYAISELKALNNLNEK